jgi:hypothetical protein
MQKQTIFNSLSAHTNETLSQFNPGTSNYHIIDFINLVIRHLYLCLLFCLFARYLLDITNPEYETLQEHTHCLPQGNTVFWESTTGLKPGPSAKGTKDLLKLNRDQLRWVVGLFTGHCHLKGHLFKLGLTDDHICVRCLEEDKSATHILCDCKAIVCSRFRHLGQFFMEPSDHYDNPINKVLHFIRGVGLIMD